ncbi:MAG TPA: bile acid:sodium symporter family protein [Victivallales bacterium]|nr:bile acid:sodium symporter family protein [Victivallales bacterium]
MNKISIITKFFPLWAILVSIISFYFPGVFTNLKFMIIPLLMIIMFAMGITLELSEFKEITKKPFIVLMGVVLQFTVMPLLAFFISKMFGFSEWILIGMILVGCVPGGTASNVMCYIAKGNVALSIVLTSCTTLLGVVLTPILVWLYASRIVPVPIYDMLVSIFLIVIIPIAFGVAINTFSKQKLAKYKSLCSFMAMLAIVLIIAIVVSLSNSVMQKAGLNIFTAVILLNVLGLAIGYIISRWCRCSKKDSIAIAFEIGMQDSGLGVALAVKYFSPLAALPSAIYSIWHNISGSYLAAYWATEKKDWRK